MSGKHEDRVDGWRIVPTRDGGYGVFDDHGLLGGPYGSRAEAISAALRLPKPAPTRAAPTTPKDVEPGSDADVGRPIIAE